MIFADYDDGSSNFIQMKDRFREIITEWNRILSQKKQLLFTSYVTIILRIGKYHYGYFTSFKDVGTILIGEPNTSGELVIIILDEDYNLFSTINCNSYNICEKFSLINMEVLLGQPISRFVTYHDIQALVYRKNK